MTVHQPKNGVTFQGTLKSDTPGLNRAGLITATLTFSLDGRDYEFVVFEETFAEEQFFAQKYPLNGVVVYTSDS